MMTQPDPEKTSPGTPPPTASELLRLPRAERAKVLGAAAELAARDYADATMTEFEPAGLDDLCNATG